MDRHRRPTRGSGFLESFLAHRRATIADRLLADAQREGRILDIGCGSHPTFLQRIEFAEKVGIDQLVDPAATPSPGAPVLVRHDVHDDPRLPFEDASFDAVTMLAVFEHIRLPELRAVLRDVHRVLRPDGVYVLTTPAWWTEPILRAMARLNLVSSHEIDEHHDQYDRRRIRSLLADAGFGSIETGSFELGMNLWARARR